MAVFLCKVNLVSNINSNDISWDVWVVRLMDEWMLCSLQDYMASKHKRTTTDIFISIKNIKFALVIYTLFNDAFSVTQSI